MKARNSKAVPRRLAALVILVFTPSLGANSLPNPGFQISGGTSPSTHTPKFPSGPSAAYGWNQSLLSGTFVTTSLVPSTNVLAGSCGNMLRLVTDAGGTGAAGAVASAALVPALPPGSRGSLDLRVQGGSVRVGFLTAGSAIPGLGSVIVNASSAWQHVTFQNPSRAATGMAIQVLGEAGKTVEVTVDNGNAYGPVTPRLSSYDHVHGFGPARKWISGFAYPEQIPAVGDFDGDGLDDIATFLRSAYPAQEGHVYVALNSGSAFTFAGLWQGFFGVGNEVPVTGDFDGDGRDDIAALVPQTGKVWVALSSGTAFCTSREWYNTGANGAFFHLGEIPLVGDFNGDGRDDLAVCNRGAAAEVRVALSTGRGFAKGELWQTEFCGGTAIPRAGDVDGDGRADMVAFLRNSATGQPAGDVEVALSNGTNAFVFGASRFWHQNFAPAADYEPLLADLNGDGSKDLVAVKADGKVYAALKTAGRSFGSGLSGADTANPSWQWHHDVGNPKEIPLVGRFNRDLNEDLSVFVRGERLGADFAATFVSFCAGHAVPEPDARLADFGYGTMGPGPTPAVQPLLVLLTELTGTPLSRTPAQFEQGVFGPGHPNVKDWFAEMSNGVLTLSRAGFAKIGPVPAADLDPDVYRSIMERACDADGPAGLEMKNFDTDADGIVEHRELAILGISSDTAGSGNRRWADTVVFPADPARKVRVMVNWAYAGDTSGLHNMAHETAHAVADMADLYGSNCRGMNLTLASCTAGGGAQTSLVHLDPWHKIRMGWVKPLIYDLKYFPAGEALRPAQFNGERPVILFDSTRGTHEFFVLEHRNGRLADGTVTWTGYGGIWNSRPRTSYPAAGYDMDVRASDGNRGFLVWAVKTNAGHQVEDIPQLILPSDNNTLDSVPAGDDVIWTSDSTQQIHCGPDGILQSVAAGDDDFAMDALCLPTTNPTAIADRSITSLNASGETATTLRYYNTDDSGVTVRGDDPNGDNWQFLEWGTRFRPWLEYVGAPTDAMPGDDILITGNLGRRERYTPRLVGDDGKILTPDVVSWTGAGAIFKVPYATYRGGRYRLMIVDKDNVQETSNAYAITLADYCSFWTAKNFSPEEIENPSISGDDADPDRDGIPNLGEYMLGTDPHQFDAEAIDWIPSAGVAVVDFYRRLDRGCVKATLQISSDLVVWQDVNSVTTIGNGAPGTTTRTTFYDFSEPPRGFMRLKFTRP